MVMVQWVVIEALYQEEQNQPTYRRTACSAQSMVMLMRLARYLYKIEYVWQVTVHHPFSCCQVSPGSVLVWRWSCLGLGIIIMTCAAQ